MLREANARDAAARAAHQAGRRALDSAREMHTGPSNASATRPPRAWRASMQRKPRPSPHATRAASRKAEIETALAGLLPTDGLATQIDAARLQAAEHRATETEARSSLQTISREREAKTRRLDAIATERTSWQTRRDQADTHRIDIDTRLDQARRERDEVAAAPDAFILARRKIVADVETAEATLRTASDARAAAETTLAEGRPPGPRRA